MNKYDIGEGISWGYCQKHLCPAQIYSDGHGWCWWELIRSLSLTHDLGDIIPVKVAGTQ